MKKFFSEKMLKVRKGFSLPEILVACAVIIALSVGAFVALNQAQQTRKMAQMHQEMDSIATACLEYEALNINGEPPASISALITGLTAANSIDGTAHNNFINSGRSTTSGIMDPWGVAYGYSQTSRAITCTPKDPSGASMTQVTRNF